MPITSWVSLLKQNWPRTAMLKSSDDLRDWKAVISCGLGKRFPADAEMEAVVRGMIERNAHPDASLTPRDLLAEVKAHRIRQKHRPNELMPVFRDLMDTMPDNARRLDFLAGDVRDIPCRQPTGPECIELDAWAAGQFDGWEDAKARRMADCMAYVRRIKGKMEVSDEPF